MEQIETLVEDMERVHVEHRDIAKQSRYLFVFSDGVERMLPSELNQTLAANRPLGIEVYQDRRRGGKLSLVDFNIGTFNGSHACNENISQRVPGSKMLRGGRPDRAALAIIGGGAHRPRAGAEGAALLGEVCSCWEG